MTTEDTRILICVREKEGDNYIQEGLTNVWMKVKGTTKLRRVIKAHANDTYDSFYKGIEYTFDGKVIQSNDEGKWPTIQELGMRDFDQITAEVKRGHMILEEKGVRCPTCGDVKKVLEWNIEK